MFLDAGYSIVASQNQQLWNKKVNMNNKQLMTIFLAFCTMNYAFSIVENIFTLMNVAQRLLTNIGQILTRLHQ